MNENDKEFRNWARAFSMQYKYEMKQPAYYSKYPRVDLVEKELERLDQLEEVIVSRDTSWVEDYCAELQRNKSE